jgi:hypothetical protein
MNKNESMPNRITEHWLDAVVDGIVLNVETEITGEPIREPDTKDANGKVIRGKIRYNADGEKMREFEPVKVQYKLDLTGTVLRNIFTRARNDIVVQIGKDAKSGGLEAVNKLNGSTVVYSDIQKAKPVSTEATMQRAIAKLSATGDKEKIKQMIAMLEKSL